MGNGEVLDIEPMTRACKACGKYQHLKDSSPEEYKIPDEIKHHPHNFKKHWMEKQDIADSILKSYITITAYGISAVHNQPHNTTSKEYEIVLGDENTLPRCSCHKWRSLHISIDISLLFSVRSPFGHGMHCHHFTENPPFSTLGEFCNTIISGQDMAVTMGNVGEGKIDTSMETYNHDASVCEGKTMSISNTVGVVVKIYANCASLCREAINEIRSIMFLLKGMSDSGIKGSGL